MQTARRGAQLMVKSVATALDIASPQPPGLTVLAYHRIGAGSALELDLAPEVFNDQMTFLGERRRVVSLSQVLAELGDGDGRAGVAVTFDDGTADFVEHALPTLVANRIPITYYVASRFIEEGRPFPDNGRPLSWAALADAISTGLVSIGSHTHNHAVADKLTPSAMEDELRRCAGLIEDRLGVRADDFAYPKGVHGGLANERVVAKFHRSAALANCRTNSFPTADPIRVNRTPIQRSDSQEFFRRKVDGGLRLEGTMRSWLNRRRYSTLAN